MAKYCEDGVINIAMSLRKSESVTRSENFVRGMNGNLTLTNSVVPTEDFQRANERLVGADTGPSSENFVRDGTVVPGETNPQTEGLVITNA